MERLTAPSLQRANAGERSRLAVEIRGLSKSFGRTKALDGLDLIVAPGDITGFLGPNGAGKSTTIRVLLGLLRADGGTVRLLGGDPWHDAVDVAPPNRLRPWRCDAVAQPDRPAGHRFSGPAARQRRRHPPARPADRAVRTRPPQEGPHLLQRQSAEGGDRRRVLHQRRALHSRRTNLWPGPIDGEGISAVCRGGGRRGRCGAAVQSYPGRGREAVRQRHDHPCRNAR